MNNQDRNTGSDPLSTSEKVFIAHAQLQKMNKNKFEVPTTQLEINSRRRLTDREIIMCKSVFKDSIDYSKVWIICGGLIQSWSGNAMTPFGNITLPHKDYMTYSDFSIALPHLKYWFIHEITHVWQH